jgi:hypothetical protein
MAPTHRQEIAAILAGARAERTAVLSRLSPALRASLPVDATGITQAIEHLGEVAGLSDELRRRQARAHQANPAVLHGRVFGRAPLSPETVTAAFVEGARVRAGLLAELARALGGPDLEDDVAGLLAAHPPDADAGGSALQAAYAAQEAAALLIACRVDAS